MVISKTEYFFFCHPELVPKFESKVGNCDNDCRYLLEIFNVHSGFLLI